MSEAIETFELNVPEGVLVDLRARLQRTRWPEAETVADWSQGARLAKVKALCAYWADGYDWRRCEAKLNGFGQFETEIDGTKIHFLHVKSPNPNALPLIMTHGWPGSVVEFLKVIGPLTDPAAHGGDPADAFHVVAPSLPGYGFSAKPAAAGYGVERIAETWVKLMRRLGYTRFVAQGGDWGAAVTTAMGIARPPECAAIHLNMPLVFPEAEDLAELTEKEAAAVASMQFYREHDSGYAKQQGTRPQTLGYGLTDSPAGQAAWIYEKFYAWTDNAGDPESALSRDEMLDNIMLYWLPANAASSARLYWESGKGFTTRQLDLPVGVSIFPKEMFRPSRRWAERSIKNIIHWNELEKGGHFAAFEQPGLFVDEVRTCFRQIRREAL
jgi:pimeloyl-ACP methyl ester carboxylesterase